MPWFEVLHLHSGFSGGLCDGDKNQKCCRNCDRTCQTQESQNQKGDTKCTAIGGKFLTPCAYCAEKCEWAPTHR